jgi:hypothetical protein
MPRKKLTIPQVRAANQPNCFAYFTDSSGKPSCHALNDVYCLKDKSRPCPFRKTPAAAARARQKAARRLAALGR